MDVDATGTIPNADSASVAATPQQREHLLLIGSIATFYLVNLVDVHGSTLVNIRHVIRGHQSSTCAPRPPAACPSRSFVAFFESLFSPTYNNVHLQRIATTSRQPPRRLLHLPTLGRRQYAISESYAFTAVVLAPETNFKIALAIRTPCSHPPISHVTAIMALERESGASSSADVSMDDAPPPPPTRDALFHGRPKVPVSVWLPLSRSSQVR